MPRGDWPRQGTTDADTLSVVVDTRVRIASAILLDPRPWVGDWVVVHSGLAVAALTDDDARAAIAMREGTS